MDRLHHHTPSAIKPAYPANGDCRLQLGDCRLHQGWVLGLWRDPPPTQGDPLSPGLESQSDRELSTERAEPRTRGAYPRPSTGREEGNPEGPQRLPCVSYLVPECRQKFVSDPRTATNLLTNKSSTDKIKDQIGFCSVIDE